MTTSGYTQDTAVRLRDELREVLTQLGIEANVQSATIGLRRTIVLQPLPLNDARLLVEALADERLRERVREANRLRLP